MMGLPQEMGGLISGTTLGYLGFMALYILVLIILGMFLDSISIMLVILPLVIPIAETLGVDLVAFGIITVVGLEMGLLTPPLGLCVYVVKSTLDDARVSLADIFVGSAPFVVIMLAVVILLVFFPVIANTDPADPFRWLLGLFGSGGAPAS
jgi:C4-dicarboxylate transporter DctM subunit